VLTDVPTRAMTQHLRQRMQFTYLRTSSIAPRCKLRGGASASACDAAARSPSLRRCAVASLTHHRIAANSRPQPPTAPDSGCGLSLGVDDVAAR
jgi:hypothetical protein